MEMGNPIGPIFKGNKIMTNNDNNQLSSFLAGMVFLAGLLLGGLIGAGVALLLAPQAGHKTRRQIQRKGRDLREQTTDTITDTIEDGVAQVRSKAQQVTSGIQEQTEALQQRGQDVVDKGKERFVAVVEAGKAAVNST
jgi:gas vesicle protein